MTGIGKTIYIGGTMELETSDLANVLYEHGTLSVSFVQSGSCVVHVEFRRSGGSRVFSRRYAYPSMAVALESMFRMLSAVCAWVLVELYEEGHRKEQTDVPF